MPVPFRRPPKRGFDKKRWDADPRRVALVAKLRGFTQGDPVMVNGDTKGVVEKTDETTLTVYVRTGRVRTGYNVGVVEHT